VVGGFNLPQGLGVTLELQVELGVLKADGVVTAPALKVDPLVEEQGLADTDAMTGDFFAFDIQASLDALQKKMHRTVLPLCATSAFRVACGCRSRAEPGWGTCEQAPLRRVGGSFHGCNPTPPRSERWARRGAADVGFFMAAGAAADTMTKWCIAAPSESLTGTVRTKRRLGVARSARASEGALVMTRRSRCVHTVAHLFC
jgi:hypothetical protein